jgi:hypothetical protein
MTPINKTCKICKASFIPLTLNEKMTSICYVCQNKPKLKGGSKKNGSR